MFFLDHQVRLGPQGLPVHSDAVCKDDFHLAPAQDFAAASVGPDAVHLGVAGFLELCQGPVRDSPCASASEDVAEELALAGEVAGPGLPVEYLRLLVHQAVEVFVHLE